MIHITNIDSIGLALIQEFEGFRSAPYPDPATGNKPYTIGYGTTIYPNGTPVSLTDPEINLGQATQFLLHDISTFEKGVDALTIDSISQNQFSALVSFAYNLGLGNLKVSSLLKKVNANPQDPSIPSEFLKWTLGGGHIMPGLVRRRQAEAALYSRS